MNTLIRVVVVAKRLECPACLLLSHRPELHSRCCDFVRVDSKYSKAVTAIEALYNCLARNPTEITVLYKQLIR